MSRWRQYSAADACRESLDASEKRYRGSVRGEEVKNIAHERPRYMEERRKWNPAATQKKGVTQLREAEQIREVVQLKKELHAVEESHRYELAKQLEERKEWELSLHEDMQEERDGLRKELHAIKSERHGLQQVNNILEIDLQDARREAEEAKADLFLMKERDRDRDRDSLRRMPVTHSSSLGDGVDASAVRELKAQFNAVKGKLAVYEYAEARAVNEEVQHLHNELKEVREDRDKLRAEIVTLRGLFSTVEMLKGDKVRCLEEEVTSLSMKCENTKKREARILSLESKVSTLHELIRDLKDTREIYMSEAAVNESNTVIELTLELSKTRQDKTAAMKLVEDLHHQLTSRGRSSQVFDDALRELSERANETALLRYGFD